jgi:hypothetical protein
MRQASRLTLRPPRLAVADAHAVARPRVGDARSYSTEETGERSGTSKRRLAFAIEAASRGRHRTRPSMMG